MFCLVICQIVKEMGCVIHQLKANPVYFHKTYIKLQSLNHCEALIGLKSWFCIFRGRFLRTLTSRCSNMADRSSLRLYFDKHPKIYSSDNKLSDGICLQNSPQGGRGGFGGPQSNMLESRFSLNHPSLHVSQVTISNHTIAWIREDQKN